MALSIMTLSITVKNNLMSVSIKLGMLSSQFVMCNYSEAVFLDVCDPSMNELLATKTGLCIDLYGSRSLTACS
jgi:hypothetical protein